MYCAESRPCLTFQFKKSPLNQTCTPMSLCWPFQSRMHVCQNSNTDLPLTLRNSSESLKMSGSKAASQGKYTAISTGSNRNQRATSLRNLKSRDSSPLHSDRAGTQRRPATCSDTLLHNNIAVYLPCVDCENK